jgi:hypothetical protein
MADITYKDVSRIYSHHELVLRQLSMTLEGKLLSVRATWFTDCSGGVDWGKGQVVMYGLSLSVSTVQTNYKGRSPIRELEPQRITHFSENIRVPICVMSTKSWGYHRRYMISFETIRIQNYNFTCCFAWVFSSRYGFSNSGYPALLKLMTELWRIN